METRKYKITLTEEMLGTVPKSKEVYAKYIQTKANDLSPEVAAEELETITEIEEKGWTGFHQDEKGLFVFDYLFKGFLKEAGNTVKDTLKIKNIKSKLDNVCFIFPRKIHLGKEKEDGTNERPIRVMTMQGPRVSLIRSDYVNTGTSFEIEIKLVPNKEITLETIEEIMKYGELKGLGQFRNGSYGRFTFEAMAE